MLPKIFLTAEMARVVRAIRMERKLRVNKPGKLSFAKLGLSFVSAKRFKLQAPKVASEDTIEVRSGDEDANLRVGNPEFSSQDIVLKLNRFLCFRVWQLKQAAIVCDELDEIGPKHLPVGVEVGRKCGLPNFVEESPERSMPERFLFRESEIKSAILSDGLADAALFGVRVPSVPLASNKLGVSIVPVANLLTNDGDARARIQVLIVEPDEIGAKQPGKSPVVNRGT